MTKNYTQRKAESSIQRLIDELIDIFSSGKRQMELLAILKGELHDLDEQNPDFANLRLDFTHRGRIFWIIIILLIGWGFDYMLLYTAITILISITALPKYLQYLVPPLFILLEIGVSYLSRYRKFDTFKQVKRYKWLPYFMLFILIGMSAMVITYALNNYDKAVDGDSMWSYALGTMTSQMFFLIGSIIFHVFIIRNSEEIAEMIAFLLFVLKRASLVRAIAAAELKMQNNVNAFLLETRAVAEQIKDFVRDFPRAGTVFADSIPGDLQKAMDVVMGRKVFTRDDSDVST